jgi:hypothetical protein
MEEKHCCKQMPSIKPKRFKGAVKMEKGAAKNFELVAYHHLEGMPAIKIGMQVVNGKWYLYLAHIWHRGWSILDITNPAKPQYLKFIPGPENTCTAQVVVAGGIMIAGLEKIAEGWGGDPEKPITEGLYI